MVRYLYSIFFICSLANASEQVCEGEKKVIEQKFRTVKDMIIVLEQSDDESKSDSNSVRFIKKPNEWDSISKWIQVPKSSQITINSIALRKDKCKTPHHDEWLDCWIKTTTATYMHNDKGYKFKVNDIPEAKYLGCKSSEDFFKWVEH